MNELLLFVDFASIGFLPSFTEFSNQRFLYSLTFFSNQVTISID